MEALTLALAITAGVLSLLAFVASATTAVIVIGWKSSTHKVVQVPVVQPETRYELDLPPDVLDQMPSNPEPRTVEQYLKQVQREADNLDDLYRPSFE